MDLYLKYIFSFCRLTDNVALACLPLNVAEAESTLDVDNLIGGLDNLAVDVIGWGRTRPFDAGDFQVLHDMPHKIHYKVIDYSISLFVHS